MDGVFVFESDETIAQAADELERIASRLQSVSEVLANPTLYKNDDTAKAKSDCVHAARIIRGLVHSRDNAKAESKKISDENRSLREALRDSRKRISDLVVNHRAAQNEAAYKWTQRENELCQQIGELHEAAAARDSESNLTEQMRSDIEFARKSSPEYERQQLLNRCLDTVQMIVAERPTQPCYTPDPEWSRRLRESLSNDPTDKLNS